MQRIEIETGKHPHFIGAWFLPDLTLADRIIDFFEQHQTQQRAGATASGVDPALKKSTDITVKPRELREPANAVLAEYMEALYACYLDYLQQWPFLAEFLKGSKFDIDSALNLDGGTEAQLFIKTKDFEFYSPPSWENSIGNIIDKQKFWLPTVVGVFPRQD